MALGRGFGKRNRNPWVAIPRSILIAFVMSKIVGFFAPEAEPRPGDAVSIPTALGPLTAQALGDAHDPVVVAVNGMAAAVGDEWDRVARAVAASRRVVVPDFHSNAKTAPRPWIFGVSDGDAERVLADVVEHASPSRPVALLGKSWGGALAARYAAAHPHRVSRLVLVAPAQSNATVAAGLAMPTLLLWARDDAMVRVHHADAYAKHAPKLTRHTVRKGGHRVLDEYTAAVRDFVLQ